MKFLALVFLSLTAATAAHARVGQVVYCADDYTAVRITGSGGFGSRAYTVALKDLRNGEIFSYEATEKNGSFIAKDGKNPTINTGPSSISFVKAGWGLVVIEGENCEINLK